MTAPKLFPFTKQYLLDCFEFDFENGLIFYKERFDRQNFNSYILFNKWNNKIGRRAFKSIEGRGYLHGKFENNSYKTHRIIYFAFHGLQPLEIDHKDQNRQNNKISNLTAISKSGNQLNKPESGILPNKYGKYIARVVHNGIKIHLAECRTAEEAHATMNEYRKQHNLLEPKYLETLNEENIQSF